MISLNGVRKQRLTVKETSLASCEVHVLDQKYHIIVQGIFVGIIIKASAASLKVTDLLFAFAFCKNQPGKLVSSLVGFLLTIILITNFSELFRPAVKQQHNQGELQSVFVILFFILFIGQLSMQFW